MQNTASWNKILPRHWGMSGGRAGRGRSYPFSQGGSTFFLKNMPPPACCWSQAWFNISLQLLACTRNNKDTQRNMCQKINVHCNTGVVTLVQQGSNWYATTSDVVSFIMMSNYSCSHSMSGNPCSVFKVTNLHRKTLLPLLSFGTCNTRRVSVC